MAEAHAGTFARIPFDDVYRPCSSSFALFAPVLATYKTRVSKNQDVEAVQSECAYRRLLNMRRGFSEYHDIKGKMSASVCLGITFPYWRHSETTGTPRAY